MNHDIIGDIHGHCDALTALLRELGYRERAGAWRHSERTALFLGDFIDRGPKQVETVMTVRRMIDAGSARAVMGNHELNAMAWLRPHPNVPGESIRPRSGKKGAKNRAQHAAFLAEVEGKPLHEELVNWFHELPLWLDLPGVRLVHACWHPRYIDYLAERLVDGRIGEELLAEAMTPPEDLASRDTPEPTLFKAVDALAKGLEAPLPAGHEFADKDGHPRRRVRVPWWSPQASTFRNVGMLMLDDVDDLPDSPLPEHLRLGHDGDKPVFLGHYWMKGEPSLLSPKVACVDYSVGKGGKLVAYRWDGEPELDAGKFAWVGSGR